MEQQFQVEFVVEFHTKIQSPERLACAITLLIQSVQKILMGDLMNRREVLAAFSGAGCLEMESLSREIEPDKRVKISAFDDGNQITIVFYTQRVLSCSQLDKINHQVGCLSKKHGVNIIFKDGVDGVQIIGGASGPYVFRTKLGDYEIEIVCQTMEEVRELLKTSI